MTDDRAARERLLEGAMAYVGEHGIGDLSLRGMAPALGTSHRMLIYHFGSKEGLLRAVVERIERQQRDAARAELERDPDISVPDLARRLWKRVSDPEQWPYQKLFFEVYVQALQGHPHAQPLLDAVLEATFEPLTELHRRRGVPRARARAYARLGVATSRGLLLDLLATEDRRGVDQAMKVFIELYEIAAERLDRG
ncbi:MAG: TetR family transcriptional regulator [Solirubrobacteraceae bacterium]